MKRFLILIFTIGLLLVSSPGIFAMGSSQKSYSGKEPTTESDPIFLSHPVKDLTGSEVEKIKNIINQKTLNPLGGILPTEDSMQTAGFKKFVELVVSKVEEKDPFFKNHPANQLTQDELLKLQTLQALTPETNTINTFSTASVPPAAPVEGEVYVNQDSGATCSYQCFSRAGVKSCEWWPIEKSFSRFYSYSDLDVEFEKIYNYACKPTNTTGTPPVITFTGASHNDVVNINDITSELGNYYIIYNLTDETLDESVELNQDKNYATYGWIYLTKINDINDLSLTSNKNKRYPGPALMRTDLVYPAPVIFIGRSDINKLFFGLSANINNVPAVSNEKLEYMEGVIPLSDLEPGTYGFIIEVIDADHNRVISEFAPLKILIN